MQKRALPLEELPLGQSACITVEGTEIALFHQPEGVFALASKCPHKHGPLHEGAIENGTVTCPWHAWQFRLADGGCANIPGAKTKSYPVEVRDGAVWVDVS